MGLPICEGIVTCMTRAKFKVDSITRTPGSVVKKNERGEPIRGEYGGWATEPGEVWGVVMSPVYPGLNPEHENSKFWAATPAGQITFHCVNPAAMEQFVPGEEYYVDFTPAK